MGLHVEQSALNTVVRGLGFLAYFSLYLQLPLSLVTSQFWDGEVLCTHFCLAANVTDNWIPRAAALLCGLPLLCGVWVIISGTLMSQNSFPVAQKTS